MVFDLHIHTNLFSGCSNIDPEQLLIRAKDIGLDGIALTEHGIRWSDEDINKLKQKVGVGDDLIVIPGQEAACYSKYGRFQGEFLVFGFPQSLGSNKSIEMLTEMVHEQDGVVIAAHPFKKQNNGDNFYGSGEETCNLDIDGLEIEHPSYGEDGHKRALLTMQKMKIAGIGCSDAHDLAHVGRCRTIFERRVVDERMLCSEIRSGRVRALKMEAENAG